MLGEVRTSGELFLTVESLINDGKNNYLVLDIPMLGFIFRSDLESNPSTSTLKSNAVIIDLSKATFLLVVIHGVFTPNL